MPAFDKEEGREQYTKLAGKITISEAELWIQTMGEELHSDVSNFFGFGCSGESTERLVGLLPVQS